MKVSSFIRHTLCVLPLLFLLSISTFASSFSITETEPPILSTLPAANGTSVSSLTDSNSDTKSVNGKVSLSSGYLNIRSTPSGKGGKLGIIPNHTVLALEEHIDGWYRVSYNGVTGYVAERYIVPTDTPVLTKEELIADLMKFAISCSGLPYADGSSGPNSFDCSGFTSYVYLQAGCFLNRTVADQFVKNGIPVEPDDLLPGDLVFFRGDHSSSDVTCVGIYLGDDEFIYSSSTESVVKCASLLDAWFSSHYAGAKRII